MIEGHTIQQNHRKVFTDNEDRVDGTRKKVRDALKIVTDEIKGTPLPIKKTMSLNQHTTTVYDELIRKHLASQPAHLKIHYSLQPPLEHHFIM